jgi:hypothetical protein
MGHSPINKLVRIDVRCQVVFLQFVCLGLTPTSEYAIPVTLFIVEQFENRDIILDRFVNCKTRGATLSFEVLCGMANFVSKFRSLELDQ